MEAEDGAPEGAPALPELEGYLSKLKHKTALVGGWTRRYFRTDGASASLVYYASEGAARARAAAPSGAIRLADVLAVREFDDTQFQVVTGRRTALPARREPRRASCWCAARARAARSVGSERARRPRRGGIARCGGGLRSGARAAARARESRFKALHEYVVKMKHDAGAGLPLLPAADAPAQSLTPGSFKRRRVLANAGREYSRQASRKRGRVVGGPNRHGLEAVEVRVADRAGTIGRQAHVRCRERETRVSSTVRHCQGAMTGP